MGALILALIAAPFAINRYAEYRDNSAAAIERETGVTLPAGVEVVETDADLFSLADGQNYDWRLRAPSSLVPWAESLGAREGPGLGGWTHVRTFQEVTSSFRDPRFETLGLHSVWRFVAKTPDGREETSYLYVASDETTAVLGTFRP